MQLMTSSHRGISPVLSQMVASEIMNTAAIRVAEILAADSTINLPKVSTSARAVVVCGVWQR